MYNHIPSLQSGFDEQLLEENARTFFETTLSTFRFLDPPKL